MPRCSSGPIRLRRLGARSRGCSVLGRAMPPTIFPITSPAAPAPTPPTDCSRAQGASGCRSGPSTHTGPFAPMSLRQYGRGDTMKTTRALHGLGQSLWLDNITRNMLRTGVLRRYIEEMSVTGLTSNPTIFDHAIKNSKDYDEAIKRKLAEGKAGEKLFFELALEDLTEAADLFRPVYDQTCGVDGWVSLEVSPLLAHDTKSTIAEVKDLHARAQR